MNEIPRSPNEQSSYRRELLSDGEEGMGHWELPHKQPCRPVGHLEDSSLSAFGERAHERLFLDTAAPWPMKIVNFMALQDESIPPTDKPLFPLSGNQHIRVESEERREKLSEPQSINPADTVFYKLRLLSEKNRSAFERFIEIYLPENSKDITRVKMGVAFFVLKGAFQTEQATKELFKELALLFNHFTQHQFLSGYSNLVNESLFKGATLRKAFGYFLSLEAASGVDLSTLRAKFIARFKPFEAEEERGVRDFFYENHAKEIEQVRRLAARILVKPSEILEKLITSWIQIPSAQYVVSSIQQDFATTLSALDRKEGKELKQAVAALSKKAVDLVPAPFKSWKKQITSLWKAGDERVKNLPDEVAVQKPTQSIVFTDETEESKCQQFCQDLAMLDEASMIKARFFFGCLSGNFEGKRLKQVAFNCDRGTLQKVYASMPKWTMGQIYKPDTTRLDPTAFRDHLHFFWIFEGIAGKAIHSEAFVNYIGGMSSKKIAWLHRYFCQRHQRRLNQLRSDGAEIFSDPYKTISHCLEDALQKADPAYDLIEKLQADLLEASQKSPKNSVCRLEKRIKTLLASARSLMPEGLGDFCRNPPLKEGGATAIF